MGSLIEAAAKRLEQLRTAGIAVEPVPLSPQPVADVDHRIVTSSPALHLGVAREAVGGAQLAANGEAIHADTVPYATEDASPSVYLDVDLEALAARGFVTPTSKRALAHDQFRVIKRQLIRNATSKGVTSIVHGNLIMITSAIAGEGKTFSAVNLAMSIASELDHTVLLVDADVARPSVLSTLAPTLAAKGSAGANVRGLMDLLEGDCELKDVLMRTNIDKLTVLPSGAYRPHATELLSSDTMRQLLEQIAKRYPDRIVIFDSPPLLMTTEAQVLATLMGQVLVVVNAGRTPQTAVKSALATIEACPVKMLMLNQADVSMEDGYSGYGYRYGYGESRPGEEK